MLGIFYLHKSEEEEESELFFLVYSSKFSRNLHTPL